MMNLAKTMMIALEDEVFCGATHGVSNDSDKDDDDRHILLMVMEVAVEIVDLNKLAEQNIYCW